MTVAVAHTDFDSDPDPDSDFPSAFVPASESASTFSPGVTHRW